jgi:hypothetical protein
VIHFFWDRILGTYRRPDAAQTQVNGTLRTGGPGRFPPFETDVGIEASMTLHESNHGTQNGKNGCPCSSGAAVWDDPRSAQRSVL